MSNFEISLRQIIYHYSQQALPIPVAIELKQVYDLPSGRRVEFAPITKADDISLDARIAMCKDILVPDTLGFFNDEMRSEYYDIFCTENLMREIEFETVTYFLARWKTNIRKCLYKYNAAYEILYRDIDFLADYERSVDERTDDDTTHGRQISGTGKSTLTHGMQSKTENESQNENKTVFEDTPENELLNQNYATNITKQGGEASGSTTVKNSGADINDQVNTTKESGKTERDLNRILREFGRNKPISEIINEMMDSRINVIENMVNETAKGLFMKVW